MKLPRPTLKAVALFGLIWLSVGFFSGTLTLLGPVRWMTNLTRASGWSQGTEDLMVNLVIILYVVLSGIVSVLLTRWFFRSDDRRVRLLVPGGSGLLALLALIAWLNPQLMISGRAEDIEIVSRFSFGPYPNRSLMSQLKDEGYTTILTLLNPSVVPFEASLLAEERRVAEELEIELIHLPMSPWIGKNTEALNQVRELANRTDARFYVHCYLGKDRVNVVRRVVEEISGTESETDQLARRRDLMQKLRFERGNVVPLEADVFLTPFPTEEEYLTFILGGTIQSVVTLLEPDVPDELQWIEREQTMLEGFQVELHILPISTNPYDPEEVRRVVRQVRSMARPVVIHDFLFRSAASQAFLQTWLTDLPSLPPLLYSESMADGELTVIAPNIAIGPVPRSSEFGSYLRRYGIREICYLGSGRSVEAEGDREIARSIGLKWTDAEELSEALLERLREGGPWYVYGPALHRWRARLEMSVGPALPDYWSER